jgi:hypothetical protein
MYALDVSKKRIHLTEDEKDSLQKISISEFSNLEIFKDVISYIDTRDGILRDGFSEEFPNLVTFAGVLKYDTFPLSGLIIDLLHIGEEAMGCPVEIEFAVNLPKSIDERQPEFAILQIRPLIVSKEQDQVVIDDNVEREQILLRSERALGHGVTSTLEDIIYVKPTVFDSSKTFDIAKEIGSMNERLAEENRQYMLVGPGRWGSQDHWLGIPVQWGQISQAKVIVETDLADFHVKPSQGTHFLQNIIAQGVGYISIPYGSDQSFIDWFWLSKQKSLSETDHVRHIRLDAPLVVKIDGRSRKAIIGKP